MAKVRNEIGGRIREARKNAGVKNLKEAADMFGVSEGTWGNWERGDAFPGPEELLSIAEKFGVTFDYLFTGRPTTDPTLGHTVREHQTAWGHLETPPSDFEARVLGMLRRIGPKERQHLINLITNAYYDEVEGIKPKE